MSAQAPDSLSSSQKGRPLNKKIGKNSDKLFTKMSTKQIGSFEGSNSLSPHGSQKNLESSGSSGSYSKSKTNSSSFSQNGKGNSINRNLSLESTSEPPEASVSKNPTTDLFKECMKDLEMIDYNYCHKLISQSSSEKLLKDICPYTQNSVLHVC
mmetsp:Transcript_22034/g.21778  ORF Transcript_22034/g.21778 Transcript_22034/m.21778 type:complete len:154 (+) Transcript_22034:16-477(+)